MGQKPTDRIDVTKSSKSKRIDPNFIAFALGAEIIDDLSEFPYRNIKNPDRGEYRILSMKVKNCTNEQDGQEMVLYMHLDSGELFVREKLEFFTKFNRV